MAAASHAQTVRNVNNARKNALLVAPVQTQKLNTPPLQTTTKSITSSEELVDTPRPKMHRSMDDERQISPTTNLQASKSLQQVSNPTTHQHGSKTTQSPRLIVEVSPVRSSQSSTTKDSSANENSSPSSCSAASGSVNEISKGRAKQRDQDELENLKAAVEKIKAKKESGRARPLICQDITNSNADTLRISRLPQCVTYDRLLSMVQPFGEVDELVWTASDPYVCDVTYSDAADAREAKHFLGGALVGNDSEPPLKAELRSRDPGAQLFVGDLTPDVTEEMLEATFSELVGEPVSALLKRDPDSYSPIGYGFLTFKNESSANFALVAGHRIKVGKACVRVGRAERNTYLYVSDLSGDVSSSELKNVFGKFGSLVEEDTVIVRRSYAFIRYKNRGAAEKAKRTLDKTDLKGRLSVRYAEAEPLKACVAVQFHSSVPRPPNSLRDLLSATFSKHGNCSVEIPRLQNGLWRKVAFVTFHGEPIAANLAALEAVQSIRFVSALPVCCQFARELIPRLPSRGMLQEKLGSAEPHHRINPLVPDRSMQRNFFARKNIVRRAESGGNGFSGRSGHQNFENRIGQFSNEGGVNSGGTDYVPVYVPVSALQHPGNVAGNVAQSPDGEFPGFQQPWQTRMMMAQANPATQAMNGNAPPYSGGYSTFTPQDRVMRW